MQFLSARDCERQETNNVMKVSINILAYLFSFKLQHAVNSEPFFLRINFLALIHKLYVLVFFKPHIFLRTKKLESYSF